MTERTFATADAKKFQGKLINHKKIAESKKSKKIKRKTEFISEDADKNVKELDSETRDYKKAGEIAIKVREFAKNLIKPGMSLLKIAQEIEKEIYKLGGEPAFPVNLSIDEIAAHYHPTLEDEKKAEGLLKIDIGVHINGFIADTAFSIDLTKDNRHKELIKASQDALENALLFLQKNPNSSLNDIGKEIQGTIQKRGFSPIVNLSGHSLAKYKVHAGITIPNYANNNNNLLEKGAYAIEPFATTGEGKVIDGQSSNIYAVISLKYPRSPTARKILDYVSEKYKTLPFSLREMQEKFGAMARLALRELEQAGIVRNYPQLIEISHKPVSQAEHTIIKTSDGKIIVTTR